MSSVGKITKKTDNRFLHFYELEAIHRDGKASPYFMASRTGDPENLKAVENTTFSPEELAAIDRFM